MPSVADIRAKYPSMAGLDDDQVVDALQHAFYPGVDRSVIASKLGVAPPAPPPPAPAPPATIGDRIGDAMISAEKGAISVPETAVGLADLATGGRVGKFLANDDGLIGFRPAQAKAFLDSGYSPAQKAAMQKVGDARGFLDTAKAVVENPSTAVQSAIESLPSMGAGGVVSRGALAVLPRLGGIVSGALGEGIVQSGQAAEGIRQETPDGLLTPTQSALAVASGAGDTALALLGGKVAHSLGLHDAQTMLAVGHGDPAARQGIVKSLLGGALSEGVLEELPQSIQEQVAQNAALGKPLDEGVDQAAVMGLFTGAAMGGAANALGSIGHAAAPPVTGPTSRAAGVAVATGATETAGAPEHPVPDLPHPHDEAAAAILSEAQQRAEELKTAERGTPEETDAEGKVTQEEILPRTLTPKEKQEQELLDEHGGDATALAFGYGVKPETHPHAFNPVDVAQAAGSELPTIPKTVGGVTLPGAPAPNTIAHQNGRALVDALRKQNPALLDKVEELHAQDLTADQIAKAAGVDTDMVRDIRLGLNLPSQGKAYGGVTMLVPADAQERAAFEKWRDDRAAARMGSLAPGEIPTVAAPDGSQRAVFPDLATAQASLKAARARDGVKGTPVAPHPLPDGRFVLAMPGEFGRPYPSRTAATAAAARAPGAQAVKVDGGWMVAPAGAPQAAPRPKPAEGFKLFPAADQSLDVPRSVMPQIAAEHRGALVNFLKARGVTSTQETVDPNTLKPTQAEYSPEKVQRAKDFTGGNRSILVSSDGRVIDGHHQWQAARETGQQIPVIRLNAPATTLLPLVSQMPNATMADGRKAPNAQAQPAAPVAPAPAPTGAVRTERPAGARTTPVEAARLPQALTGAKPRYAFGSKQFTLKFASDVDRAAYIAAQAKPSKQDQKFVEWATAATGMSEKEVREHGAQVRAAIKEQARAAEKGGLELSVPDQLGEAPEFRARIDTPAGGTLPLETAQRVVTQMTAGWKGAPTIHVVARMEDIPGYDGERPSRGIINLASGETYVVANQAKSAEDIAETVAHEVLGHFGLRAAFGGKLVPILDQLAVARPDLVAAKAKAYGLDMKDLAQRREAADEVLAELAEKQPTQGWVKRAIAAVRNWLRAAGLKLNVSDNDIAGWLASARRAVERNAPDQNLRSLDAGVKAERRSNDTRLQMSDMLRPATEAARGVNLFAGYKIADYLRAEGTPGKLSLWHKTVGTMFHLAETHPAFKPVFNAVQSFIRDTSFYANEAADLAPRIIPKLEGLRDLKKQPLSVADTRALGPAVFGGIRDWTRDAAGNAVEVTDAQRKAWNDYETNRARAESENAARAQQYGKWDVAQKRAYLLAHNHITPETMRMWDGQQIDAYERLVNGAFNNRVVNASKAPDEPLDSKPGILFTDEELKRLFNLNDHQVSLYHETRATVDHSLDEMGVTAMIRAAGQTMNADLKARVLAELSDGQKTRLAAPAAQVKTADAIAKLIGAEVTDDGVKQTMQVIADQIEKLKAEGYMPASRFGTYTLDVKDGDERLEFRLFESARERARFVRHMQESGVLPRSVQFVQGTTSQSEYQLFNTISPDSLQLFADLLERANTGVNAQDEVFQQYLREARAQNSAMKRLIHRKGIAGYSEDVGRVLAGFVYSNGRVAAHNLHNESIGQAIQAIPQGQGELKDAAVRLASYVQQPQEEAAGLRGLLFAQLLGGSVASAIVNATQPFATTLPYLSQFGGLRAAGAAMSTAAKLAAKMAGGGTTGDAALDAALKRAAEEGTTAPQEVHQLQGQASGRSSLRAGDGTRAGNAAAKAANAWTRTTLAWGKVFGVAEQFNRRLTFIAAFNMAREQKMPDPAAFAKKAVDATQFVNNKGNKPQWARGAIGATLFTFKQYTVSYLEMLTRMAGNGPEGRKALLYAIAALTLMAGADGLPFVENIDDVVDALMQRLGYNFSTKTARHKAIQSALGDDIGKFFEKGMTGLPGVPIDVSGRLGMARPLPGTGLLVDKADHSQDMLELAGPVGDIIKRGFQSAGQLAHGNVLDAVNTASPKAVQNAVKGVQMAQSGEYDDASGKKVMDTDMADALSKFIGFQPKAVSEVQGAAFEVQKAVAENRLKQSQLADDLAQALHKGDTEEAAAVRDRIDDWNRKNPDTPIRIKPSDLRTRLRSMNLTKTERIEKAAPKAMRAEVASRLAESQ